jgi:outer membrane autotransporter protein
MPYVNVKGVAPRAAVGRRDGGRGRAAAVLLFLLAAPATLYARDGWYLGVDAGWSHASIPKSFWIDGPGVQGRVKNDGPGFQVYGGYQFQPHLALEAGYLQAGQTSFSGFSDGVKSRWAAGTSKGTASISGLRASAVGLWPIGRIVQVYAKGGVLFFDTTTDYRHTINLIDRFHDNGGSGIFGLGFQARLGRGWNLRGEYQYTKVHLEKRATLPVHFLTLGVMHPIP